MSRQYLQSVMRCHIATFDTVGGALEEVFYDRVKSAVLLAQKVAN